MFFAFAIIFGITLLYLSFNFYLYMKYSAPQNDTILAEKCKVKVYVSGAVSIFELFLFTIFTYFDLIHIPAKFLVLL